MISRLIFGGQYHHRYHLSGLAPGTQSQLATYVGKLAGSKICLIGGHGGWGLRKYIEAMAAGCVVLGDLPADNKLAECMVEMPWGPPAMLAKTMKTTLDKLQYGGVRSADHTVPGYGAQEA